MDNNKLKKKLKEIQETINTLEQELSSPESINNSEKLQELSVELSERKDQENILSSLVRINDEIEESSLLASESDNPEMKELAQNEVSDLKKKKKQLEIEIFESNDQDRKVEKCILEIRAGAGGDEASLFASDLFRMYSKYAETNNWSIKILSKNQTGTGGFKEIICEIQGRLCYFKLQYESGVHRVQRVPVTESSGRIHTSTSSVVVYPLLDEKEININPADVKFDVYRASGPGGQSVNTTDSAVRVTHIPTGTIVTCQDEKSQHKNKKKVLSILASRLEDLQRQKQQAELSKIRKSAIKSGDRSAKIRTYNFPQNRITDHRIKKSWHNIKEILDGDIDTIFNSIRNYDIKNQEIDF